MRKFFVLLMVSVLLISLSAMTLQAEDTMELSLKQAMKLALQKNFDVQLKALDTEASYSDLLGAYGIYNYYLNSRASFSEAEQRQYSSFSASESNRQSFNMTFGRKIFTGADVSVTAATGRSASDSIQTTLNPQYSDSMTFSITQPILQDWGRDNTEKQILINKNSTKLSDLDFKNQVISTLVNVQNSYWDLVSAYEALKVSEDSLELARQQLEINKVKVRIGTLPEIEIVQAEQQVATSESSLIDAQITVQRAVDNLKTAIVMDDWNIKIVPTDKLIEPDENQKYEFADALNIALENRTEVQRLDINIDTNDININSAKNMLKPQLDLTAEYVLSSAGGNFTPNEFGEVPPDGLPLTAWETFKDVFSNTNNDWNISANFTYTFSNDSAEASLVRNEVGKKQNLIRKEQLRYTLAVEVRNAIREINNAVAQLEARRKSLLYAEKQYEAEKQKFDVGTSTNFQVLDFQNRLIQARNQVISAQIRHSRALIDYERAIGKVLEKNDIKINTTREGIAGTDMK